MQFVGNQENSEFNEVGCRSRNPVADVARLGIHPCEAECSLRNCDQASAECVARNGISVVDRRISRKYSAALAYYVNSMLVDVVR